MKWQEGRNERWGRYARHARDGDEFIVYKNKSSSTKQWCLLVVSVKDPDYTHPWEVGFFESKDAAKEYAETPSPKVLAGRLQWHEKSSLETGNLVALAGDERVFEIVRLRSRRWSLRVYRKGQSTEEWPACGMTHFRILKEAKEAAQALAHGWITPALSPEETRRRARKERLDI